MVESPTPGGSSSSSSTGSRLLRRPPADPMEEGAAADDAAPHPKHHPSPSQAEPVAAIPLAQALQAADGGGGPYSCSPCPATGRVFRLAARLAARRVQPLPAGVGHTGAVPWSLYLEDATAAVRVVFAAASGPPPVQLLEAEADAQGKPRGASLLVEGWQCLRGQQSSSTSRRPNQQQPQQPQRTPAELAAFCIEVSAWRLQEDEEGEGPAGKRQWVGPRSVYMEGLWATGTARVVTPVLKGRRKRPPASASSSTTATVRAPSRAVVLLRLPVPNTTIAVVLQGERCLRCQPALRPGWRYHFPLLRPTDPAGNEDDRLDYWGSATSSSGDGSASPPPVFVAQLPPVEMERGRVDREEDFAARSGLFAYPDHRPCHAGGGSGAGGCLQARVLHFEGVVRAPHRNGTYYLEAASAPTDDTTSSSNARTVPVFLASPTLGLGTGLRKGARVRFWNVHPVVLGGRVQALGGCLWTHVELLEQAPPASAPSAPARPYLLPANGTHRHRPLAYLAWAIRLRGQLQRKLFGPGNATTAEAAAMEPWLNAWAKRLSGVEDLRADPLLPEAILHDAACGLPCPTVFGGLPTSTSSNRHQHHHQQPPAAAAAAPVPSKLLSPPTLAELPSLRAARQEAARRCREALLGGGTAGDWWPVLERAGVGRMETLPLGAFDLAGRGEGGRAEEDDDEQQQSSPRAVLMGLLVRQRGGCARLVDATGSMPLHFTLPGATEGEGEQRLVHWREGYDAPARPPWARPMVVGEAGEGDQARTAAATARIAALPWAEAPATAGAALAAEQAGRMVALRGGCGKVQLFADVLSWRRQQGGGGGGGHSQAAQGPEGEDCVDVTLAAEDGGLVTVKIRPFLLVGYPAVLPLQDTGTTTATTASPSALAPPQPAPAATDWRACRLAPMLRLETRRARSGDYWSAPPLRLLVLVRRVEQQGLHGHGEGRVVLLCKDANDPAPDVARLFLTPNASHCAANAGVCAPGPFPGAILLTRGLRGSARPGDAPRRIDLFSAPGCSIQVEGYRPLSAVDHQLASATFEEPCPRLPPHIEADATAALLQSVRPGRLCELGQTRGVYFGLLRLQVMVICFKAPSLSLKCPACRSFADRCGGRCGVRMEPWWEVHCTVGDGTGQANVLADGELAVRLLRIEPQRRQRLEAALFAGQAPTGGIGAGWRERKDAVGEWLWAELFRDPGERARRLRRLELVVQEVLLKFGKGDGKPLPQARVRRCEWVDGVRRDVPEGSGGTSTYNLHMPAVKPAVVAEADPRMEAYETLRELAVLG